MGFGLSGIMTTLAQQIQCFCRKRVAPVEPLSFARASAPPLADFMVTGLYNGALGGQQPVDARMHWRVMARLGLEDRHTALMNCGCHCGLRLERLLVIRPCHGSAVV